MDINAMLKEYRMGFGLVREGGAKEAAAANPAGGSQWDTALTLPTGDVKPGWGARIEMPEELPSFQDERDQGDPAINQENFKAYLQEHPFAMQKGGDIEELIKELSSMVQDEENPLTYEDAERIYTEEFSKMYGDWEMGGAK